MPVFRFRLEAQDGSGHFREGRTVAASKEEARATLEAREAKFADFQLSEERVAELCSTHGVNSLEELPVPGARDASEAAKEPFRALAVRDRAHLNAHRQARPYKLVSLKEEKVA